MKLRFSSWKISRKLRFAAVIIVTILCSSCPTQKPFDSEGWLRGNTYERSYMVHDLLERKHLTGKSRQEVLVLLGKPDDVVGKSVLGPENESVRWQYIVDAKGACDRFGLFTVSFDAGGKVLKCWLED